MIQEQVHAIIRVSAGSWSVPIPAAPPTLLPGASHACLTPPCWRLSVPASVPQSKISARPGAGWVGKWPWESFTPCCYAWWWTLGNRLGDGSPSSLRKPLPGTLLSIPHKWHFCQKDSSVYCLGLRKQQCPLPTFTFLWNNTVVNTPANNSLCMPLIIS